MNYVASKQFKIARDFIGHDVVTVSAGEVCLDEYGLTEKHALFMLKNELITESQQTETETATLEADDEVVFEVDNSAESIMSKAIAEANEFSRRKALDEWAEEKHGINLDGRNKLDDMKSEFAAAITQKMQSVKIENKMIDQSEEDK